MNHFPLRKTGGEGYREEAKTRNAQFRPFFELDLFLVQQLGDGRMIAKRRDIVTGYLEPTADVGNEFIGVGVFRSVPRTPRLAFSLVPHWTYLGCDLPPTADINSVFPTPGNLEAAA
jgi:hypothetical protein